MPGRSIFRRVSDVLQLTSYDSFLLTFSSALIQSCRKASPQIATIGFLPRFATETSLAQTDALAKLLIEKGIIAQEEFMEKTSKERGTYQKLFNPTPQ